MKKKLRSCTSLLLAFCLLLGVCSNGLAILAVDTGSDSKGEINYVSIGDSMANGYGFVGYHQTSDDRNVYDVMTGKGMYGDGAYPLQFEEYLVSQGYEVNHTKLATSAMLAEDLLYLLDGREEFDDGWGGYKHYVGTYTDAELKPFFQEAITNADVITMGIGNASFGAFMLDRVTSALGVFGASLDEDELLSFKDAIGVLELDEQQTALVMEQYENLEKQLIDAVPAEYVEQYNLEVVVDIISYTVASYVVNYKLLVEKILEMNPDVEIVLVGLLNTTYGMNVTDDEGNVIMTFGDTMDDLFDALNAYMAGLPVLLQSQGVATDAKLYFAEQPEPKFICQVFEELMENGWGDIQDGRLSGTTVRERNIEAYNGSLAYMIGMAVTGSPLPAITLADVKAYEDIDWAKIDEYNAYLQSNGQDPVSLWGAFMMPFNSTGVPYITDQATAIATIMSVSIYLGIEEAVAKSTDTMDIQLSGLMKIAGDLSSVFVSLGTPPQHAPEATREWLMNGLSTDETRGMCKIYGLFKVGNGMSVHPTPEGHDEISKAVIAAYDGKYAAADHAVWYIYEQLKADGILSDDDKAAIVGFILSEMKGDNKDIALVEDVYSFLNGQYLSNEETIDVVIYVYEIMLGVRSENEVPGKIYELLNDNTYLTDDEKIEIIEYIYSVLKANGYLNGYDLALVDDLYAFINANEYLTNEQKVDIIVYVYGMLLEDGDLSDADKTAIVQYVYGKLNEDGQMSNEELMAFVAGISAILDKHQVVTDDNKVELIESIFDYLVENGYVDMAKEEAIKYAKGLADELEQILVKNLQPVAEELKVELKGLNMELKDLTDELDVKMAALLEKQNGVLADMIAERDALVEELASLNAKLEAIKNGSYGRSVITASAKDAMITELEADIARTEAEIAELEATIAWVAEQLKTDKSGIEAIKAAIADVKANIIATEAALAEVNAAIDQLVADLVVLNDALEVLAEAAKALADKTVGKVDVEAVIEAVETVVEKLPSIIASVERTYELVVEIVADVEDAMEEIKASAALIEENVKNLAAFAEEMVAIAGEQAEELKKTAEQIAALAEAFVKENLPAVEEALEKTYADLEAVALRELAKAEELWNENEQVIYAALAVGYWYCEQKGYIDGAKELVAKYAELLKEELADLEIELDKAETVLTEQLAEAEKWLNAELPVWEARLAQLKEDLKATADAETKAAIEAAIAKVEAKIAEIEAKIEEVKEIIAAVKAYIAEVKAAIADVHAAAEAVADAAKVVGKDVKALCNALKNLKSALCELSASVVNLHNAVADEVMKLLGYCGLIAEEAIDVVETLDEYVDLLGYIPAMLEEAYIDATTDNYLVSIDSHYVALGDKNAYGAAADKLAAELTAFLGAQIGYDNLTVEGQSAEQLQAALSEYAAAIEKADLVTVGFSANTFTQFVVNQLQEALAGGTPAEMAWEAHLGEQGAACVAEAMAALKAELVEAGAGEYMGMDIADIVVLAVESYAYSYMEFVIHYVQAIEGIHAINPDAQVVLVGMHNPMAGVVLNVEGTEIALGDYLNYIVEVSNVYSLGYAFVASQTIFVDAPAVETANEAGVQEVLFFVMNLMMNGTESYVPTDAGHTYIQEQIWNALNVYKVGMLGDVDSDGDVDYVDAMLTLQYYTEEIGAEDLDVTVADVDGNGVINYVDAMLILQHYTQEIAVFPAA